MNTVLLLLLASTLGQVDTFITPSVTEPINMLVHVDISVAGADENHPVAIHVNPIEYPILEWMRELEPLPKVHYSWKLPNKFLEDPDNPYFYEYVRLSRGASLSARPRSAEMQLHANSCVKVCKRVNLTGPRIPASIAINYSPYHAHVPIGASPLDRGEAYLKEIARLELSFDITKLHIDAANANNANGSDIQVGAILLDSERYYFKDPSEEGAEEWNDAINENYQTIYDIVQDRFPNARVEWYSKGMMTFGYTDDGVNGGTDNFRLVKHHDPALITPGSPTSHCSLYSVHKSETTRETLRRTYEHAQQHGIDEVVPWIALGSGYGWKNDVWERSFHMNYPYHIAYSRELGAQMNMPWYQTKPRYGPWNKVKIGIFYPEPFGRTHDWGRHFVAYVRGASGIIELPVQPKP